MIHIKDCLLRKEKELQQIRKETSYTRSITHENRLRISNNGNRTQYYIVHTGKTSNDTSMKNTQGSYLAKKDKEIARELAQYNYDARVYDKVQKQLDAIQRLIGTYNEDELEMIFTNMSIGRKHLVEPRIITDEMYKENWSKVNYEKKGFAEGSAEIYTNRGERVRSKSEKIIADMLDFYKVPYQYEKPLVLNEIGRVYPDFTILCLRQRKDIYWEHFGMMDNLEYSEKALRKISFYGKSGYMMGNRLITTFETMKYPLDTELIKRIIISIIE